MELAENCLCFDSSRNPPALTIAEKAVAIEWVSIQAHYNYSFNEAMTLFTRIFVSTDFDKFCSIFAVVLFFDSFPF